MGYIKSTDFNEYFSLILSSSEWKSLETYRLYLNKELWTQTNNNILGEVFELEAV